MMRNITMARVIWISMSLLYLQRSLHQPQLHTGTGRQPFLETVKGLDGGNTAYVWVGIIQEVKDGKVIKEINTGDYPLLYDSAVESINYSESTLDGAPTSIGQQTVQKNFAAGVKDYVHVNSVDYTLDANGNTDKILVSMRDQSAVTSLILTQEQSTGFLAVKHPL